VTATASAVQIAAAALGYETHSRPGAARDVVGALSARYAFVDRERLAALEAVAEAARGGIEGPPGTERYRTRDALAALDAVPAAESDLPTALRKVVRDGEAGDGNLLEALAHTLEMPVEAVDLRVSRFDGTVGVIFEVPDESIGTAVTEVIEKRRDRRR
jgi:hypothetical protein